LFLETRHWSVFFVGDYLMEARLQLIATADGPGGLPVMSTSASSLNWWCIDGIRLDLLRRQARAKSR
jgi:hypothetical protein